MWKSSEKEKMLTMREEYKSDLISESLLDKRQQDLVRLTGLLCPRLVRSEQLVGRSSASFLFLENKVLTTLQNQMRNEKRK